jgi:hypothetical protein
MTQDGLGEILKVGRVLDESWAFLFQMSKLILMLLALELYLVAFVVFTLAQWLMLGAVWFRKYIDDWVPVRPKIFDITSQEE